MMFSFKAMIFKSVYINIVVPIQRINRKVILKNTQLMIMVLGVKICNRTLALCLRRLLEY